MSALVALYSRPLGSTYLLYLLVPYIPTYVGNFNENNNCYIPPQTEGNRAIYLFILGRQTEFGYIEVKQKSRR